MPIQPIGPQEIANIFRPLQPPTPLTAEQIENAKALRAERLAREGEIRAQQQTYQEKLKQQQQAEQDQQDIQGAVQSSMRPDGSVDYNGAFSRLNQFNVRAADALQKTVYANRKALADAEDAEHKRDNTDAEYMSRLFSGATADNWADRRAMALQYDPSAANHIPEQFDPIAQKSLASAGVSVKEQNEMEAAATKRALDGDWVGALVRQAPTVAGNQAGWEQLRGKMIAIGNAPPSSIPEQLPADMNAYLANIGMTPEQKATLAGKAVTEAREAAHTKFQEGAETQRLGIEGANLQMRRAEFAQRQKEQAGQLSEEALNQAADKYIATGQLPSLGMGTAAAGNRAAIMNRAGERHPGTVLAANSAEYKANAATLAKLTTQLNAVEAFEKTGLNNLKLFTDAAAKIPDTGMPWLNAPVRSVDRNVLGSANMAAYDAARQVALTEISRVVSNPNLTGALSDSARQEVLGLNPSNATFNQIKRVAGVLTQDMENRRQGIREQQQDIIGRLGGVPSAAGGSGAGKTVTMSELQAIAKKRGTTVEQERQRATAAGYNVQ